MRKTIKVLFICVHNSARSQMAEAFLNRLGEGRFQAESAGLEPGVLNPRVIQVMAEAGYDISRNTTNGVMEYYGENRAYDVVITVCSKEAAERCPIFPGKGRRLHWPFDDPSSFIGSEEEILAKTREVRDGIRARILEFIEEETGGDGGADRYPSIPPV
jgi:arsenate reductase